MRKDKIEKYTRIYAQTYKRKWLPMRFVEPLMLYIERQANRYLEEYKDYFLQKKYNPEKELKGVIVSLTSFPARINYIWKTIVSIKSQSFLPEKIVLWLSKEEFKDNEVPIELIQLVDDRFEIRFVEGNLKSHKKYYYALKEFPDFNIITLDDDTYYHKDLIKSLVQTSEKYPGTIVANWVIKIRKRGENLMPYTTWKYAAIKKDEKNLFPIGVSGVFYPPDSLHKVVEEKALLMTLTPTADDIWLNAAARLNGTRVVHTGWKLRNIPVASHTESLTQTNCGKNMNDVQLVKVREYFKTRFNRDIYI